MGLFQQAVLTYDNNTKYIGDYSKKAPLAPVAHIISTADIIITLTKNGEFLDARKAEDNQKVIIPATEDSAGRTSAPKAHPLCDGLIYLADYDEEKHSCYLTALEDWANSDFSHPFLFPVLTYIKGNTIVKDLADLQLIELDNDGHPKKEKLLICWRISDDELGDCWTNKSLFKAFEDYYDFIRQKDDKEICMISGEFAPLAKQHAKGVVPLYGNAKLISANDNSGFTYRGRFSNYDQALSVGYKVSQKSHNALRWLIAEHGVYLGGRVFLCWNPQGKKLKNTANAFLRTAQPITEPTAYKAELRNTLLSFMKENQLTGTETAVTVAFEASTNGRLSTTFYSEQTTETFMKKLAKWDEDCCCINGKWGIQSPSLWDIVNNAFGTERTSKNMTRMEADDKVKQQQMQRLIACKLGDQRISADIVIALVNRASTPQAYTKYVRSGILFTACAVLRKYRKDNFGEEWSMALEETNTNRSYLFGRLLAIAEKVEQDTYDKDDERLTNAMKLQSVFSRRPLYAWRIIEESLNPYYQKLKKPSYVYYKRLIGEIIDKLSNNGDELDVPLDDVYLLGYYHQRQELYRKKTNDTTPENTDTDNN